MRDIELSDVLIRDLLDKAGDAVGRRAAEEHTLTGAREDEVLTRAGERDVAQAALLLHLVRLADAAQPREDTLLAADDEHRRELQTLGRVHGHERDAVGRLVIVIEIRIERDLIEEARERGVFGLLGKGDDVRLELLHVFDARSVLRRVLLLKGADIAAALHDQIIELIGRHGLGLLLQLLDQDGELAQTHLAALQLGIRVGVADDVKEARLLLVRELQGRLDRARADAAGGRVDDARQAQVVVRRLDDAQIGEHILDLGAVKKARAADNAVRDAVALEGIFELVALRVHAVEHGVVAEVDPLPEIVHDLRGDVARLVVLVRSAVERERVAGIGLCPERFALAAGVVGDDVVGGIQDAAGATVVLLEADGARVLVLLFKIEDVLDRCAAELVDALVIVPDDADVAPAIGKQGRELILEIVRVLILVDEHIAEAALPVLAHVRMLVEQAHGVVDQVVKVHRPGGKQALPVGLVYLADADIARVMRGLCARKVLLGRDAGILGAADLREHGAVWKRLFIEVHLLDDALDDCQTVRRVIDREAVGIAKLVRVPPQDAHARGVEGRGPDIRRSLRTEHPLNALLELIRRLVRERDGDDAPRLDRLNRRRPARTPPLVRRQIRALEQCEVLLRRRIGHFVRVRAAAVLNEICDPVDEHRGFTAAGSGQQQQWAFRGQDRFSLHIVQVCEVRLDEASARLHIALFKSHGSIHSV